MPHFKKNIYCLVPREGSAGRTTGAERRTTKSSVKIRILRSSLTTASSSCCSWCCSCCSFVVVLVLETFHLVRTYLPMQAITFLSFQLFTRFFFHTNFPDQKHDLISNHIAPLCLAVSNYSQFLHSPILSKALFTFSDSSYEFVSPHTRVTSFKS